VGVIQRGQHFGFALKACEPFSVFRERRGEDLDRDLPFQLRIGRAVDLAHPACAEGADDLVRAEARTGEESHQVWWIITVQPRLRR
jgi:hypothetical protein